MGEGVRSDLYTVIKTFLQHRIQLLKARTGYMSEYIGVEDPNRLVRAPVIEQTVHSRVTEFLEISQGTVSASTASVMTTLGIAKLTHHLK